MRYKLGDYVRILSCGPHFNMVGRRGRITYIADNKYDVEVELTAVDKKSLKDSFLDGIKVTVFVLLDEEVELSK